ncbi:MAG TPA: bifunctional UDP-N-acetylglucosamine diphosphorylase/glucosamine-1-phosphate N-acetyltransferase GlmU [Anaerolineales bacterium]|nr:bifunctional UDP-N-acetylglucosamine diphosphorylase/glucosamine-1-phosphate N-acetyltransferase GlmU [Anaerolineales bacterium]
MAVAAVILAAGQGTRMRSDLPKVLHPLSGQPMVLYSIQAAKEATGQTPVLVIGHAGERIQQVVGEAALYAVQEPQLGTGHAVQQAQAILADQADMVLVTLADMPLLTAEILNRMIAMQEANAGPISMATITIDDPRGFGRVVRDADGRVTGIVEEAQANEEQLAIRELNASIYCFRADWLWQALKRVPLSAKGEYYLTDVVHLAVADGYSVQALRLEDSSEAIGINTRIHLSEAENLLRQRINRKWMLEGVTIVDPATTYIEPAVMIGQDSVIWPNTHLRGNTRVGKGCTLGPNTIIHDSQVGEGCKIVSSILEQALLEDHVDIGPFAHLRKGAHLASGVHMGNFGEVKNSYLGPGVKMGHFSYIGDATIHKNVNIGAGTITCNYDGEKKNHTEIGEDVFIGSDTMLVAPLKIGKGSKTGAGSVVTRDIPDFTLAVGVPARLIRKLESSD